MRTIYLLSGLGADEHAFSRLNFDDERVIPIKWLKPLAGESLENYATRLEKQIDSSQPIVLIGLSFGGMLAIEMSKRIKPKKTILISSVKTKDELPWWFWIFRILPVYFLIPGFLLTNPRVIAPLFFLRKKLSGEFYKLFAQMLQAQDPVFIRWAIHRSLWWNNEQIPENVVHIHGTKDLVFPYRLINNPIAVTNGTHLMVLTRAKELSAILRKVLYEK